MQRMENNDCFGDIHLKKNMKSLFLSAPMILEKYKQTNKSWMREVSITPKRVFLIIWDTLFWIIICAETLKKNIWWLWKIFIQACDIKWQNDAFMYTYHLLVSYGSDLDILIGQCPSTNSG